jgi:hypothetical protein
MGKQLCSAGERDCLFYSLLIMLSDFFHNPLSSQPGGEKHDRQSGTRVGARTGEVQVLILRVAVLRTQVAHLLEVMA